jgi:hypothetical protein
MIQEGLELRMRHRQLDEVLHATMASGGHDDVTHLGLSRMHRRTNVNDYSNTVDSLADVAGFQKVTDECFCRPQALEIVDLGIEIKHAHPLARANEGVNDAPPRPAISRSN